MCRRRREHSLLVKASKILVSLGASVKREVRAEFGRAVSPRRKSALTAFFYEPARAWTLPELA
jgi:hypothetical protein